MNTSIFVEGSAVGAFVSLANVIWAYGRVRTLRRREPLKEAEQHVQTQVLHAFVGSPRGRVDLLEVAPEMEPAIRRVIDEALANPAVAGESITIEPAAPEAEDR
jgi:hypothetical protein